MIDLYVHLVTDEPKTLQQSPKPLEKTWRDFLAMPQPNKYTEVRRFIKERMRFDTEFASFVEEHSRVELCERLTQEFGWTVCPYALGRNLNRHR